MYFTDRIDAANQLLSLLRKRSLSPSLVLAIPRGGVPIGCALATAWQIPLDLLMAKKLSYPGDPEYAIGAVSGDSVVIEEKGGVDPGYLEKETARIRLQLSVRYRQLSGNDHPMPVRHQHIIVTDDGIATGRTMLAAVIAIKKQEPASVTIAVPVCSLAAKEKLLQHVTTLISCYYPDPFIGVGRFYRHFGQVTDEEVIRMLRSHRIIHPLPNGS